MKTMAIPTSFNPLFVMVAIGLILMLGIILASENLNAFLSSEAPVMAATPSTNQIAAPTPPSSPAPDLATTSPSSFDVVGSFLNDPQNFRVVPKDIKPAQAIIEGKTIKFLMGF